MNSDSGFCLKNLRRTAVLCACTSMVLCANLSGVGASPDARKIMEDVYSQDNGRGTFMRASFEVFDKEGLHTKKEFVYRRIGSPGNSKTLVVFTAPAEIRGVALLSINGLGLKDRQFMYTPGTRRVRSVVPQERSARFIGTDFTFEDIEERVLDDFTYRLLSEADTIEGHKTWKVEATPVDPSRSQYKYIYYWIAQDTPVILHAEMYDAQGREVRVLHATQIKRESGIYGARHTEMSSVLDGTKTVLTIEAVQFNANMSEDMFTPQGLGQASDPGSVK